MKQNTPEWLEFRRNKIGSSDASCIMGVNPWKTRYQLWEEKVYGKETEKNHAMMRGSFYEEEARQAFEKMTGIAVMPKVIVSSCRPWQMSSLDGVSLDGSTFCELKVPNQEAHDLAKLGIIPDHYNIQMQHQYATDDDFSKAFYFSYLPKEKEGVVVEVKKDKELIKKIIEKEEEFYMLMMSKEPPAFSDEDYFFRTDELWTELASEWLEISRQLKELEEVEKNARAHLIALSHNKNTKGAGIRLCRSICKGAVDYKKIPELRGVDLEKYRKEPIEKWTLSACK